MVALSENIIKSLHWDGKDKRIMMSMDWNMLTYIQM
jgi:hypothetical protein